MNDDKENRTIAILYANFGEGRKDKTNDLIFLAEKFKQLSDHYGSHKKVAEKIGISNEQAREILKLLELPDGVKELVRSKKLKFEVAWRIASVKGESNQIKLANSVCDMNTHDARHLVRLFRNNPEFNFEEYKKNIIESKNKFQDIDLVILPIERIDFLHIKKAALRKNKSTEKFIVDVIISDWLKRRKE